MNKKAVAVIRKQGIVMALIVIYLVFAIVSPQFRTFNNLMLILRQISTIGVMAAGMTFVIIGGNFDLSVGSLLSVCGVVMITLHDVIGPIPAILVTILVGMLSGIVSGFFVGYLKLNSMIVTLGMMNILQAVALMLTNARNVYLKDESVWFTVLGKASIGKFPLSTLIMLIYVILMAVVLMRSRYGHQLMSVGGNAECCRFSGINDRFVIIKTFVLSGLSTAVAAILLSSRGAGAQPTMGESYEFDVITAVILGGASLDGGEGNIYYTLVGVMIMGVLKNGFVIVGLPSYVQWVAQCIVMLVAVFLDVRTKKKRRLA